MHKGKEVGRNEGEPILDEDTYGQLQAIVATARRGRRPTGEFKLTGTLLCANPVHGDQPHPMAGHRHTSGKNKRVKSYICARSSGGCGTTVNAAPVEEMVRVRVLDDANNPDLVAGLAAEARALTDARMNAAAKVERLEGMLIELETRLAEETIRPHAYQAAKAVYDRRIAEAEAEERQLGSGAVRGDVPTMTGEKYDVLTPAETRLLIAQLGLRVLLLLWRAGAPRNRFDPERVVIEPAR
jgi:hypothetical protein